SYPGASSLFVKLENGEATLDVEVPRGTDRLIQVVGLDLGNASSCPKVKVSEFWMSARKKTAGAILYGGMYELGRTVADIRTDTTIEVENTYDSLNLKNLRTCSGETPGAELMITPEWTYSHRSGKIAFQASGGVPP